MDLAVSFSFFVSFLDYIRSISSFVIPHQKIETRGQIIKILKSQKIRYNNIIYSGPVPRFLGGQVELLLSKSDLHLLKGLSNFTTSYGVMKCIFWLCAKGSGGMLPQKILKF